jgi:hypothetical protein
MTQIEAAIISGDRVTDGKTWERVAEAGGFVANCPVHDCEFIETGMGLVEATAMAKRHAIESGHRVDVSFYVEAEFQVKP